MRQTGNRDAVSITEVRTLETVPIRSRPVLAPINPEEQKQRFLRHGHLPKFHLQGSEERVQGAMRTKVAKIKFDHFPEAKKILEMVRQKFGDDDRLVEAAFGPPIDQKEATHVVSRYLVEHGVDGMLKILWSGDLNCSGRMQWRGPAQKYNRPELRKYSLWLQNTAENMYLRQHGIKCLVDHEVGTHFFRMLNDGFQPWYSNRDGFGLRSCRSWEAVAIEEGLATVNTMLQAKVKYLWVPALLYYASCLSTEMSFSDLFHHLETYIKDVHQRWKIVMRIKCGLPDPAKDLGGCGKDQAYFAGAVEILRNLDSIDFHLLYSGKVCIDELPRIKRLARRDCVKLPHFVLDQEAYRKKLRQMAAINNIVSPHKNETKTTSGSKQRAGNMSRKFSFSVPNLKYAPEPPKKIHLNRRKTAPNVVTYSRKYQYVSG
ncbi:KIAA0895L [Branchiostoma lanceolatum]|uniref:KIAA0895L protein n=1 Tax=Branchiostoma lanceolatum TaxID=7740 RepID=A0A8J9YJW5_BRALA|nr:KIAA0895L [Branchiostoma lanceolatum]